MADVSLKYPFSNIKGVKTLTASATLTKEDSGKIILLDSTTAVVAQLPPTRKGLIFHFMVNTAATSGVHAISPVAADMIKAKGITTFADDKNLEHTSSGEAIGDCVTLVGDGNVGWYAISIAGGWNRET